MTSERRRVAELKKLLKTKRIGPGTTRYDRFCQAAKLDCRSLARESGYTANYHRSVRHGICEPTLEFVAAALEAVRKLTGDKSITANHLFPLDDENDE